MKVMTVRGPMELDDLTIQDHIEVVNGARKIATEYYCSIACRPAIWPDGDLVRRDVAASMLMPLISEAIQGQLS